MKRKFILIAGTLALSGLLLTACGAGEKDEPTAPSATLPAVETQAPEPSAAVPTAETPVPGNAGKPQPLPEVPAPPVEAASQAITFPYASPDTPLDINSFNSYTGLYLEDGSDLEIAGVSSLVLTNTSEQCVDYAKILLTGSKTIQEFVVSGLEAGAVVVVQEAGKAPAVEQEYKSAAADVALTEYFDRAEGILELSETAEGKLKVTNLSGTDIPCVRIFYKFYDSEAGMYMGGITYVAKLEGLEAGASMEVQPSHYAAGSSQVVMAKIYDEVGG